MVQPRELLARAFSRFVTRSSNERLAALASGPLRRPVLNVIFRQMPKRFVKENAEDVDAAIDWKINHARDGEADRYQVVIRNGTCTASRRPTESPRTTIELDAADFLRLAAGVAQGPELFLSGKLRIDGDVMFAAQLAALFRVPVARSA